MTDALMFHHNMMALKINKREFKRLLKEHEALKKLQPAIHYDPYADSE